eukprot:4742161-Amphidinium_carterae.1
MKLQFEKCLVYMGAGISAGQLMYQDRMNEKIGRRPDTAVDDHVLGVVGSQSGRDRFASVLTDGLLHPLAFNTTPTAAHAALAQIVLAKGWPVVTTNSDVLLECAGATAMDVR